MGALSSGEFIRESKTMGKKHCASILVTWQTSNLVHRRNGQNFYYIAKYVSSPHMDFY